MSKIFCVSGIITLSLLLFLLTGADKDDAATEALRQGNQHYASAAYKEALESYETGLTADTENKALNFNAAQSAYALGEHEKAVKYYGKSADSIEKFLSSGNAVSKLGDECTDKNEKTRHYTKALQAYNDGIIKYPENVPLKYNYEALKQKMKELSNDQDQEKNDQEQNNDDKTQENKEQEKDDQKQNDSDKNKENSEQEKNDQVKNDQDQKDDDNSQENKEQEKDSQEQNENDNSQENKGQDDQNQSKEEREQNSEKPENQSNAQEQSIGKDEENEPDQQSIERILRMLENQEESSLKNNQEVKRGKGDKYGW